MIKQKMYAQVFIIALCAIVFFNIFVLVQNKFAYAASSDLFISEYVEGSGNNKAIEIYNNTGRAINLATAGYSIKMYLNGSKTPRTTVNLTGIIDAGDTYVLVESRATAALLDLANQVSTGSWFNGNDAVVLMKGFTIMDQIGIIGQNPGSAWTGGAVSTANQTLVRKPDVTQGTANNKPPFDPSVQWTSYPVDTFTNLGSHTIGTCTVFFHPGAYGTFDPAGAPANQQILFGDAAVAPTVVADDGYVFAGWDQSFDVIVGDKTVTAQYVRDIYTVTFRAGVHGTFDPNGAPETQLVLFGDSAAAPTVVTDPGYTFAGWDQTFVAITRDMILTAQYVQKSYTVLFAPGDHGTFDPTGAQANQQIAFGNAAAGPTVLANPGYVFVGWDQTFDVITQDRIITAQYIRNIYKIVFVIGENSSFNSGGGAQEQLIIFGNAVVKPWDPVRTGYRFDGWYTDWSYTEPFDFQADIQGEMIIYAKWVSVQPNTNPGENPNENSNDISKDRAGGEANKYPMTGDHSNTPWFFFLSIAGLTGMGILYRYFSK